MATPAWEPGKLYAPGALVVPRAAAPAGPVAVPNGTFDTDAAGWTMTPGAGASIGWSATGGYQSPGCVRCQSAGGASSDSTMALTGGSYPVTPGQTVSASAMFKLASGPGGFGATLYLSWFNSSNTLISITQTPESNYIRRTKGSGWRAQQISYTAPAGAAFVRLNVLFDTTTGSATDGYVDNISWAYASPAPTGLMYKAVQPATGRSDTTEPAWPSTLGVQVIDNEVIWEAVSLTRIVWQARPLLVSGATEPDWPASEGASVPDNTISWEAVTRRVDDAKCPNSKYVVIAASKVFAGDDDIIPYSATVNPKDWSSPDNAGYLPSGLQMYGANPIRAMGLYRGNVVAFNAQGSQVWQVDEDPAQMALLDAFPIGSEFHHTLAPVSNDLFLLTSQGVRSVGIAGGATNLQADDVGEPIDPMVKEALREAKENGIEPMSLYNPNTGQYWLMFRWKEKPS